MSVLIVVLGIIAILVLIMLPFILVLLRGDSWAKRRASVMLESSQVDYQSVDQVLRILSGSKDNEGICLCNELADLLEQETLGRKVK